MLQSKAILVRPVIPYSYFSLAGKLVSAAIQIPPNPLPYESSALTASKIHPIYPAEAQLAYIDSERCENLEMSFRYGRLPGRR